MARPKDHARREEILRSILKAYRKHRSWDLSLNEVARQINSTTRLLVHHFGTKEKMIAECRKALATQQLDSLPLTAKKNWKSLVCDYWLFLTERPLIEERRLCTLASLQWPAKGTLTADKTQILTTLRELLPSRFKKFAEELFIFTNGLDVYVLSGGNPEKALKRLQTYLRRLEVHAE
ncbi:hypothetical protein [Bdellovibrio bacteriovorus]|uniref:hypothetical protein n=1 Tax=Bdellovibrio bacteriovorus TaxID=959 RepID=UPI0035A70C90